jgi:hypothetical protein
VGRGEGVGGVGWWWVVVVLADGVRCGKVRSIDPMSAKRREFPSAGTVVSLPVGKQLRAYIVSLDGSSSFWFCDFLTTERVCDRSLFDFGRWKKFFYFDGEGLPPGYVDELQIELSAAEMRRPPTWDKIPDWKVELKEVPAPYRVRTHDHVEFYVEEDELPKYQECVFLNHKELVAYVKANLGQFEIITPREDQLSSPVEALPEVATFTPGCIYEIWLSGLEQMAMTDVEEIGEEIDDELEEHEAGEVIGVGGTTEEQYNIAVQCEPGMNRKALGCIRRVLKRLKANPETTDIWVQGESEKKLGLK